MVGYSKHIGEIMSYSSAYDTYDVYCRVGDITIGSHGIIIAYMHNPYTNIYYGNIEMHRLKPITNKSSKDILRLVREEKIEMLVSEFSWERSRNFNISWPTLIKKYNDNRTINEISRSWSSMA